jgi:DNA invertase Pin-like site-specific DNA recombinase
MCPVPSQTFAYCYSDPLLESVPDVSIWGRKVDRLYQDRGGRQQLQQLLSDCELEPVYLLVRRLEELGDSAQAIHDCLAVLEALGIEVMAIEDPIGAGDRTIRRSDLFQALDLIQANQRSRRLRQGHARNRIKALPPPGKAPYGYRRGKDRYAIDRAAAPLVKAFVEHFLLYGSLRGSVRFLQKKYNKSISVSTGKRWLTSAVYRGNLEYGDGALAPNTHMPIISQEEAAQIDRLLRRNRQLPPRAASAPRSLSGLVRCSSCQAALKISHVTARGNRHQDYLYLTPTACSNQPKCRSIPYQQVLEQTIQRICQDLPPAVSAAPLPDVDQIKQRLQTQLAAKQEIVNQLPALVTSGVLDAETAELRSYKLRTEISALQAQLAQLPPVNLPTIVQVVSIPQFWLDLSESERRFYFREFIREIAIDRVKETWEIRLTFIF